MRDAALDVLLEHGALTSSEFSAALGIAPGELNTVVRDFVEHGVMVRTPVPCARKSYRYTFADGIEVRRPPRSGRYASVWNYAAGVAT